MQEDPACSFCERRWGSSAELLFDCSLVLKLQGQHDHRFVFACACVRVCVHGRISRQLWAYPVLDGRASCGLYVVAIYVPPRATAWVTAFIRVYAGFYSRRLGRPSALERGEGKAGEERRG